MVTPLGLISSKMPQIFSRGECKLTMTMELGSMIVVVLCPLQSTARESKFGKSCNGGSRPIKTRRISAEFSWFRSFVGMTEPIQRVVQISIGIKCEREPAFARGVGVDAAVAFGTFLDSGGQGIEFQEDGGGWTEAAGVGE